VYEVDFLIVQGVVDVLFDNSNVSTRCGNIFGFYGLETFGVVGQNEDVLVVVVEGVEFAAGSNGVCEEDETFEGTGEGTVADG
jgi:hypothetical protein